MTLNRRQVLIFAAFTAVSFVLPVPAKANSSIFVSKGRGCGCCDAWIEILKQDGFEVTEKALDPGNLTQLKMKLKVPQKLASCHTGQIAGYVIEGHVPPADIRKLLAERPEANGLAVGGMPYGSPGMGDESKREAYDVILFKRDGSTEVFSRYEAAK